MQQREPIARPRYLEEALRFQDTDLVKVVTGVRRCGKSTLLGMARSAIESEGVSGHAFASLNLESKKYPVETENDLYVYFRDRVSPDGRTYIFIDEPQRIDGWQDAVNAMRVDFDCDIYLTGSNAYLLSSELSTYLSGRYVEVRMLPLSLTEYLDFCGLAFAEGSSVALGPDGAPVLFDDVLSRYLRYGGLPAIASLETTQADHSAYVSSVYDAIAVRDIVDRERRKGLSKVTDPALLRRIAEFLADNVGNLSSASSIANALTSGGRKTTNKTASSYIDALCEAYLFYRAPRFDLHGKEILKTNPKRYIVDLGFRSYLAGYRIGDRGRIFENAVYLQLLYDGWAVHVGKLYDKEVDFVAVKDGERRYIQVADNLASESTRERELAPLRAIKDAYPKMVVVREGTYEDDADGIRIVRAREFFLGA